MAARRRMGVKRREMAMVGDQLYADRMAAALYGIPGLCRAIEIGHPQLLGEGAAPLLCAVGDDGKADAGLPHPGQALYGIPGLMVIPRGPDLGAQVVLKRKWEKRHWQEYYDRGGKDDVSECDWKIRFGTAGTSDSFEAKGYKTSLDIPAYTAEMGLDAFEYQCGHGVRLGVDKARRMAADAAERGILFSVHAPYYISGPALRKKSG